MKIIKQGNSSSPTSSKWWVNSKIRCKQCECIFQLEEIDKFKFTIRNDGLITFSCPCCNSRIGIEPPAAKTAKEPPKPIFEEIFGEGGTFERVFGKYFQK